MNAETLERLLMDRALGELSPDVESLLAAYLEHDAQAAARADEFLAAAAAARQVLTKVAPAALPPYPALRLESVGRAHRRLVLVRNVAGVAAALVLGVGLGAAFVGRAGESAGGTHPARAVTFASAAAQPAGHEGFWSTQRLYERAREAKRPEVPRVFWDSTVERPRLEGKS